MALHLFRHIFLTLRDVLAFLCNTDFKAESKKQNSIVESGKPRVCPQRRLIYDPDALCDDDDDADIVYINEPRKINALLFIATEIEPYSGIIHQVISFERIRRPISYAPFSRDEEMARPSLLRRALWSTEMEVRRERRH